MTPLASAEGARKLKMKACPSSLNILIKDNFSNFCVKSDSRVLRARHCSIVSAVVLARFLVVVKVDTARLARGQIDRGSTGGSIGSWSI